NQVTPAVAKGQAELHPRHESLQAEAALLVGADRLVALGELTLQLPRSRVGVTGADGHPSKRLAVAVEQAADEDPRSPEPPGRRLVLVTVDEKGREQCATRVEEEELPGLARRVEGVDGAGRLLQGEGDWPGGRQAGDGGAGQRLAVGILNVDGHRLAAFE